MNTYILREYTLNYIEKQNKKMVPNWKCLASAHTSEYPKKELENAKKKSIVDKIEISVINDELNEVKKITYEKEYKPNWKLKIAYIQN